MPRDTLRRDEIVRTAIELLDADGLEGLSMRRLGVRLGSGATSVYWHVTSRDELVVLAADAAFAEVVLPDPIETGWRAAVYAMAIDTYAMLSRHHWVAPASTSHVVYGPGIARFSEHAIAIFEAAGFTGFDVSWSMNVVITFILGTALGEAAQRAQVTRGGDDRSALMELVSAARSRVVEQPEEFPRLRSNWDAMERGDLSTMRQQAFDFGLKTILDGLAARLAERAVAPST